MKANIDHIRMKYSLSALIKFIFLVLWFFSHMPSFLWLIHESVYRLDALFIIVLLFTGFCFGVQRTIIDGDLYPARSAFFLLIIAAGGSLFNSLTINFRQADLMFLMIGLYGFLGLNSSSWPKWSIVLNPAILLFFSIPFYLEFSSGLGFILRLLTASLVQNALEISGIRAISSHDIIITENVISHVDIPCSGLKSLWFGSAFFLMAIILINIKITFNTIWKYCVFLFLLLSANMFRVLILTVLTSVYHLPKIAEVLHLPIGILGFSICCGTAWVMLNTSRNILSNNNPKPILFQNNITQFCLLIIFCLIDLRLIVIIHNRPLAQRNRTHISLPTIF